MLFALEYKTTQKINRNSCGNSHRIIGSIYLAIGLSHLVSLIETRMRSRLGKGELP
jgi:hypothetical protein